MTLKDEEHLTAKQIDSLKKGILPSEERLRAAEHMACCQLCSRVFSDGFMPQELKQPLSPVKSEVMQAIRKRKQRSGIFFYDLKVLVSVCASLLLLISIPLKDPLDVKPWNEEGLQKSWQAIMEPVEAFRKQLGLISDRITEGGLFIEKTKE